MFGMVYLWFFVFILGPIGALLSQCFQQGMGAIFEELMKPEAVFAIKLSFFILFIVLLINSVIGVLMGLLLARESFPGRSILNATVNLPFAVSPIIAGLMLVLFYGPYTIIGTFFGQIGFRIIYALPGMVIATLFVTFPFVVRELVPVLQELGNQQEEAAFTLGANRWVTFWRVTLPSIKWSLLYGMVMTVARALGEFGAVLVVSGNLIMQTQSATLYTYQAVTDFNLTGAYAVSLLLISISFCILVFMQYIEKKQEVIIS